MQHRIFVAIVCSLFITAGVFAQNITPNPSTWIPNGGVSVIVPTPDTIYIGGDFSQVGPNTGHGVPISLTTGVADAKFPLVNDEIHACVSDGSGGWFIGGDFTRVGTKTRYRLAHIKSDGSLDNDWNPVANDSVYALARSGSTLYVGGRFTYLGDKQRNALGAVTTSGDIKSWNPGINTGSVNTGSVNALLVSGSTVYVGGYFYQIGGKDRNHLAAVNSDGSVRDWNPNPDAMVYSLAMSGATVYAGGSFKNIGGQARNHIAALDGSGNATAWNPNATLRVRTEESGWVEDGKVYSIVATDSTIYVGGHFQNIGGQERFNLAALDMAGNARTWRANTNNPTSSHVKSLVLSGSILYVGGRFTSLDNQPRKHLAALDLAGNTTTWNPHADRDVNALAVYGSKIYAGGRLTSVGGVERECVAALDAKTGAATAWNPTIGYASLGDGNVSAMVLSGSTVYLGGRFDKVGGQLRQNIAAVDAVTGSVRPWKNDDCSSIFAMAATNTTLYAGGYHLVAIDLATGATRPWSNGVGGYVWALAVRDNALFVGGYLNSAGGKARNGLAAFNVVTGDSLPCPDTGSHGESVNGLAVLGSTVYVGGYFNTLGGLQRHCLGAVDIDGKVASWDPYASRTVHAMAGSGSKLFVGGDFANIDSRPRKFLAAIDPATALPESWSPVLEADRAYTNKPDEYSYIYTMAALGSSIYIGGYIGSIGGVYHPYFAQITSPNAAEAWAIYE